MTRRTASETKSSSGTATGGTARTILFNDEIHSFEEVANQLVKAIRCSFARGLALANAVHHIGSAIVYEGHLERCEAVAMVLEEISLKTRVER